MVSIDMRMHDACMLSGRTRMYNAGMVKKGYMNAWQLIWLIEIKRCMMIFVDNRIIRMYEDL